METKKITPEMRIALQKALPAEAVKQHPTKTFLSTIKAIFVTERFNEVFGVGAWQLRVEHITTTEKSMVVVKVQFTIPEYNVYYECFGGNDNGGENSKNFDLGDAYKGATTDALTKIGSYMEVGIDVFKGKQKGTATPTPANPNTLPPKSTDDKPWLNKTEKDGSMTDKWNKVETSLREGKCDLKYVLDKFKVSKENQQELQSIIDFKNKQSA